MRMFLSAAMGLLLAACAAPSPRPAADGGTAVANPAVSVIPRPASVTVRRGTFRLAPRSVIAAAGEAEAQVADHFVDLMQRSEGLVLVRGADAAAMERAGIVLRLDPQAAVAHQEGYVLDITPDGVVVSAPAAAGLFYGSVTLWQLAGVAPRAGDSVLLPALHIEDAPRFAWRGLMLDVARHYMPPAEVRRLVDAMALHKLNTLHWHLTDDQGWRIEIAAYPKLTEIGAVRQVAQAPGSTAPARTHRGYYTKAEVRELVRYAAARHVRIVPEIDVPGHAQAMVAAYPELGTTGTAPPVSSSWGVHTWLLNVDEGTLRFLDTVMGEVAALFPGPYIHAGGDEAAKDQWQQSPAVQARMRELGIADEARLQGWFSARVAQMLAARGKVLVGWDEILEGGVPESAVVMSWRGTRGGLAAARAGHDVVMAPVPDLYLDHLQGAGADEPPGRPGLRTLADLYAFEPLPAELEADAARHILGAQANLWSEHMRTPARVFHAAFPRAAALAEVTWSPAGSRDFADFLARMPAQLARYRRLRLAHADSAFAVDIAITARGHDAVQVGLATQTGFGTIRYTLDGGAVTAASTRYTRPLQVALPATLRATSFDGEQALSNERVRRLDAATLLSRDDDELETCGEGLVLRLEDDDAIAPNDEAEDAPRAVVKVDLFDACWLWRAAPLPQARAIDIDMARLPFNFELWHDTAKVVTRPARIPGGTLDVHRGGCGGERIAELPLASIARARGVATLRAELPAGDSAQDLCLQVASGSPDPLWAIAGVRLVPR